MKSPHCLIIVTFLVLIIPHTKSYSQESSDSTPIWLVDTEDGNSFMGSIVSEDSLN